MVSEPRYWIQFSPATHFLPLREIIPTYLAVHRVRIWPERAVTTRTREGEC
jgi:hypothetical protein